MKGYQAGIFDPQTLEHAKAVVLTPDTSFPNKFEIVTKYFVDVVQNENIITNNSVVLDFGVGMGRISKELIDRFNCKIIGTDISLNMLIHATNYVNNPKNFVTCNKVSYSNCVNVCIAVFVIQHVENPSKEIDDIFDALTPNGHLILLNDPNQRFVPGDWREDNSVIWFDDHFNVFEYIETKFIKVKEVQYMDTDHKIIFYRKPS